MSCYHPLKVFFLKSYVDGNGEQKWLTKICPHDTHHVEEDRFGNWYPVPQETVGECRAVAFRHYTIPCGKCIGCRLDYSATWANRLMLEYKYHDPDKCWFVTYTYDNENVPINTYTADDGSTGYSLSLRKSEVRQFHKNLRKQYTDRFRFFLAGEYGERTFRPHMHAIYFNLPLDPQKLVFWKVSDQGFTMWTCPELEKVWRRGRVIVSKVSWETCAYVARYVTKKLNGPAAEFYTTFNLEPEFSLMSRKPGIGRLYYEDHPDVIEKGIHVSAGSRAINCPAPRYFKNIWRLTNVLESDIMSLSKSKIQDQLVESVKRVNSSAAQNYSEYLRSVEYQRLASAAALKRSDV